MTEQITRACIQARPACVALDRHGDVLTLHSRLSSLSNFPGFPLLSGTDNPLPIAHCPFAPEIPMPLIASLRRWSNWRAPALALSAALCSALLLGPVPAQAAPTPVFLTYSGDGNLVIFDASTGSGGWVGSIDPSPDPLAAPPFPGVSTVLFTLDPGTGLLSGSFEIFSGDLLSSLFGTVGGSLSAGTAADFFANGGQLSLDYSILGGSGEFYRASGFGLAFLNYDPAGIFNNYDEIGALVFDIPTPGTLTLSLAGLLWLGLQVSARKRSTGRRDGPPGLPA